MRVDKLEATLKGKTKPKHVNDFWPIGTMIFNGDEDWYRGRKSYD